MLKGISGDGELGRGRCGGLGRCERSGLGCSMKWTAAKLLDTVRRRGDDGEHGYDGGAAMVASAMAGACEGEELERRGGVWGVRGREGGRFTALRGAHPSSPEARRWSRAAASCVARAAVAVGHLPACLAGKQLAGAVLGWAGRWAGSRRQVSFSHFLSVSVFI